MRRIGYILGLCVALAAPAAMAVYDQHVLDDQLIYRVRFGRFDDVKLLLDNGANPNVVSSLGDPVLSLAVTRHDEDGPRIARLLLEDGAAPNTPSNSGEAPILMAARNGQKQMIIDLLAFGADYHIKDADGSTLIDLAKRSEHPDAAGPLEAAQAAWDKYNTSRNSAGRFESLVRRYAIFSCTYEYWNYFLVSGQDVKHETTTKLRIADDKAELLKLSSELQTYYAGVTTSYLDSISQNTTGQIRGQLDDMISNRNRESQGVGSPGDDQKRCTKIADSFSITATPPVKADH